MKSFLSRLSIRFRLISGFGLLGLLLLVVVAISWLTLNQVQSQAKQITEMYEPQVDRMTRVELLMVTISLEARHSILAANDPPELKAALDRIAQNREELLALINETEANLSTQKGREIMSKIKKDDAIFWEIAQEVVNLAQIGKTEEAYQLLTTSVVPARNRQLENIAEQKSWQRELMNQALNDASDSIAVVKMVLSFIVWGVLLIVSVLLVRLINSIVRPLRGLLDTIVRIERSGDYSQRVEVVRNDEVAYTAMAFNRMMVLVESRNTELARHREDLEETVKLRTAELSRALEAAEAASQTKSDFLANMSHEIRTPMNGVIGMTELAIEATREDERQEYLKIVKNSATSLLGILNDILDFSKIEANKLMLEKVRFELRQTVSETLQILSVRAKEKKLAMICDFADDVPDHVLGDPTRFRQVLINLVGNAIKFTEKGEIVVSIEALSRTEQTLTLKISVRDTGIGIPADKLGSIFEAFAQADASTTRQYGGTGLGLSISSSLVNLMGGSIGVDSTEGQGTTFHFTIKLDLDKNPNEPLPADRLADKGGLIVYDNNVSQTILPQPNSPSVNTAPDVPPGELLSVLLVEDNLVNQKLATQLLKKWGHRVTLAVNGQEAVDRLAAGETYDVVLMDMQMPVMGGIEATRLIRATEIQTGAPRQRIVAMTANAMQGDRETCLAAGMDDYLTKPINPLHLRSKLRPDAHLLKEEEPLESEVSIKP